MIRFYDYDSEVRKHEDTYRRGLLEYYHIEGHHIMVATYAPKYHHVLGSWETPLRTGLWEYKDFGDIL